MNQHRFNMSLPLDTSDPKNQERGIGYMVEMDGKPVEGITAGHLKFGTNGLTNVVIEFEATALAKFDAVLIAQMDTDAELHDNLSSICNEALADVAVELDGEDLENSYWGKGMLAKRIIELTAEHLTISKNITIPNDTPATGASELALAEAQILGYQHSAFGGNIDELIESMGLEQREWTQLQIEYPNSFPDELVREIDEWFYEKDPSLPKPASKPHHAANSTVDNEYDYDEKDPAAPWNQEWL